VSGLDALLVVGPLFGAGLVAGIAALPRGRRLADVLTIGVTAAVLVAATAATLEAADARVVWLGGWRPHHGESVGVALVADRPALMIVVLAAGLTLAGLAYSWHFLENTGAGYQALMLVFLGSVAGFSLAGDLFDAFVWFELMGVTAYALTGLRIEEPRSVHGALTFGIVNTVGGSLSLLGVALLYARTGELGLAAVGRQLDAAPADGLVKASLVLLFAGVLVKLAVVPFHFWTADAEAVAATPVCVLLSGVMISVAAFALARWWWVVYAGTLDHAAVGRALLGIGAVTALLGAVMCAGQRHIKRLLAFSTVSHAGVLLCCVGLMTPAGLAAGAAYAVGHALTKSALFLGTGTLLNRHGTVDEHELYGAGTSRVVGVLFVVGGLALAGLPALGTWAGKSLLDEVAWTTGRGWLVPVAFCSAVLTGGSVLRVAGRVWWGLGPPPLPAADGDHDEEAEATGSSSRHRLLLVLPPWALLVLAVGLALPVAAHSAGGAGAALVDTMRYRTAVLSGVTWSQPLGGPSPWSVVSVIVGVVAAGTAVGLAALMTWSRPVPWVRSVMGVLHAVHRAHVGDYVGWLLVGVAVLGGLVILG
jgi:multicomponent Na+:H+ antiporter subunit D